MSQNTSNHKDRRQTVDDLVRDLTEGNVSPEEIVGVLMRSHKDLDNHAHAEREALKSVVAGNLVLAKAVRNLSSKLNAVCVRLSELESKQVV